MPSSGEMLREERVKRNRSLSDIATETCISSRYLEAIESDNLPALPGDFFYRSFLKQYADCLKLDEPAKQAILSAAHPAAEIDPIPALAVAYQISRAEGRSAGLYKPRAPAALMLLAAVVLGCSGLYAVWSRAHADEEVAPAAEAAGIPLAPVKAQ